MTAHKNLKKKLDFNRAAKVSCDQSNFLFIYKANLDFQGSHIYWKNESTPGKPGKIMEFCKK